MKYYLIKPEVAGELGDNSMQEDIYIDKCNRLIVSERLLEIIIRNNKEI